MRRLNVITAKRQATEVWPQQKTTWPDFLRWLDMDRPADHKDCGNFVLGEFTGERRRKDTVVSRSAVTLDADNASPSFVADSAAELGCALAFYTTWRHTPEKPRWRLLAPLSRDVTPVEYRLIAGALIVDLGYEQFDKGSVEPERLMHRPSSQGHYEYHVIDGEPLDADAWLARAKELGIEAEPEREPYVDDSPTRDPSEGVHPYAVRAIADELAKLDTLPRPWSEGDRWDETTFKVACNLIEFANSNWSGYSHADARADLMEHAPSDDRWGPTQHVAKWLSALNKVNGGGRSVPAGAEDAADVFDVWIDDPHPLFDATPVLAHIRQAAHSRMVSAPALLCYVLGRVLAEVDPGVDLPPTVGSRATLNLGVAVVGESGAGKSALMAVSRELLGLVGLFQEDIERNIGSGEGLAQSFLRYTKESGNVLVGDPRRIISVDEVDSLGATQSRNGSTIAPTVRTAVSGGSLGQENATADRRRHVPANSYRLVLFVGVQPTRSAILLDDDRAGTPQRLVWVRATDPTIPSEPVEWPGPLAEGSWDKPCPLPDVIDYPAHIKAEVRQARLRQTRGGANAAEASVRGHMLLTRLKVGSALALLHGETFLTDQWWGLAGLIVQDSMTVQQECRQLLLAEAGRQTEKRARAAGYAAVITAEVVDTDKAGISRVSKVIMRKVTEAGEDGMAWSDVRAAIQHKDREPYAMKARNALEVQNRIRVEDVSVGNRRGERVWIME